MERWRGGGAGESRWALQGRLESDYWGPQCVTGSRCAPSLQLSKCTESNKSPSMLCSQGVEDTPPWWYVLYPYTPLPRWACRDKSLSGGICRPESRPEARRRPGGVGLDPRLLLVAYSMGAGSCPAGASRLPPGDLTSSLLTAWLGNFRRVSFLPRLGAWSEEEPQWWGLRRGHRRALQHAGPGSGCRNCRVGGFLLKGSASTRRSACLLPISPTPPQQRSPPFRKR